jgi:hypothetical protein
LPSETSYTDELVTDENLREKIRDKAPLKYVLFWCRSMNAISALFHRLVSALHIEAAEIIDKLSLRDERTLRFSPSTLQKYLKEAQFVIEFCTERPARAHRLHQHNVRQYTLDFSVNWNAKPDGAGDGMVKP